MTRYLTLEDVLRQVERAGWGVRDAGLLASAVARPSTSAFGQDAYADLWSKAAALCQSLDNNQALVDGNKRLAWLTTKVFLAINGQRLRAIGRRRRTVHGAAGRRTRRPRGDRRLAQAHSAPIAAPDLPEPPPS